MTAPDDIPMPTMADVAAHDTTELAVLLCRTITDYWAGRKEAGQRDHMAFQAGGTVTSLALAVGEVLANHVNPGDALDKFRDVVAKLQAAGVVGHWFASRRAEAAGVAPADGTGTVN